MATLLLIGGLTGLAPFFLIAGMLIVIFLSPLVEYVAPWNAGWSRGFWAFLPRVWWPPVPGPTWFLGVLLVFSAVYALVRTLVPGRPRTGAPPRAAYLLVLAAVLVAATYAARLAVPFGEERYVLPAGRFGLALGQAPAWAVMFGLGVVAGERGWLDPVPAGLARACRRVMLGVIGALVGVVLVAKASGTGVAVFAGGGTWQSLLLAVLESGLVIALSVWLLDVFRRRYDRQGPRARVVGRAAYGAYLVHQVVLVWLVLAIRQVAWPPEIEFLTVAAVGVVASFGLAALLVRIPGLSRVV